MLLEVESHRRAAVLRMHSAEPRSSVSNNRIKDVSDDWFESWWELQISKIIWTSGNCIMLSAGLPLCRPDLMLHNRPLLCIRTRTRQALQITVTWFGKVAEGGTHHWDARFLTQVYPSLKLLGSTAFTSETEDHLSFFYASSFSGHEECLRQRDDHCLHLRLLLLLHHSLISCVYQWELSLTVSHLFLFSS